MSKQSSESNFNDYNLKIKKDKLVYLLNKENYTACVIDYDMISTNIYIPRSIIYQAQEYIITGIGECTFKDSKIETFQFAEDSQLQIIGKGSFAYSLVKNIIIPSHVITICEESFCFCQNLQSVEFLSDSELQTIEKDAFNSSSIKSLTIPSSISNFMTGWCNGADELVNVKIIPKQQQNIKYIDDKIIVGKTDSKSEEYDALVFVPRNVNSVTIPNDINIIAPYSLSTVKINEIFIPSHVKQICEGAFNLCENLNRIEFAQDSELQIIGKFAFSCCSFNSILIPSSVTTICKSAFSWGRNLQKVEFSPDSYIQIIEKNVFYLSPIQCLIIPSSVTELKNGWCNGTPKLTNITIIPKQKQNIKYLDDKIIVGKTDEKSDEYDVLVFIRRDIITTTIPINIKVIAPYSFANSQIVNISFPPSVEIIGKSSFERCKRLQSVGFSIDSEHVKIEKYAFYESTIESLIFPKLAELEDGWCLNTPNLTSILILPNNKNFFILDNKIVIGKSDNQKEEYDTIIFVCRDVQRVIIPSFIKIIGFSSFSKSNIREIFIPNQITNICESAFAGCINLDNVEIPKNSNLCEIGKYAFTNTLINSIFIPPKITQIKESTFKNCLKLRHVEFAVNSELLTIEKEAFASSLIDCIHIPPRVTDIFEGAFKYCDNLKILSFDDDSDFQNNYKIGIKDCENAIVMIPMKLKNKSI